ncbi:guanitoxin biosynthesis heme-dependent pre-guanitoxin N-hydroxylase GntA [Qipengyuania oceanensis]|uniref:YqcI/YcgG family protein n=1 Tax=Qipengyuania oceanensis TaxID=1463597 RepID=A0A844YHU4_9SPHN|nr:guanitoxin biosynthesis heme-dependent pre-guanitoxin N-hydroxylase GntA [Qipengyuania oceanensis]MXO64090.1 YqcI/YcgG family protein [Qipengyuania oceanensis]
MKKADYTGFRPNQTDEATLILSLNEHVADYGFPCVGAKSALKRGNLEVQAAWQITSAWDDVAIHRNLMHWSWDYSRSPEGLRSFAVVFSGPLDLSERRFEQAMWERLASLADKDDWLGQQYNKQVSNDPADPHFSLSFGGQAYFVVGMHPHASRSARRTKYPTLVFNLHDQFERLREDGKYERMREVILERDEALDGCVNPMLARHGSCSEARQYSGRVVDDQWRCPLSNERHKP